MPIEPKQTIKDIIKNAICLFANKKNNLLF